MTIQTSHQIRRLFLCLTIAVSSVIFVTGSNGQEKSAAGQAEEPWSKTSRERDRRIALADNGLYRVGHIYVSGNVHTRDREIRFRLLSGCRAGDVFEREALENSLKQISKVKAIKPVSIDNIDVRLDEKEKYIDFTINVVERRKDQL